MVADGAWSEKGSAEAWHGASGRTHTCIGAHQDGCVHQTRVSMKPALTRAALSRPRGASPVKLHPWPVGVQSGGRQRACKSAGHAHDLQPSGSRGRLRHSETSGK